MAELRANADPVDASRAIVDRALKDGKAYYGINTGFGALAGKRIDLESLGTLQRNLLLSHAVGVGSLVPRPIAKLMLQLKIHALGIGNSGVSRSTFDQLLALEQHDAVPAIPSKGSVGASGDLAPLAHMALPLIGFGEFLDADGSVVAADERLKSLGLTPIDLQPKDGLSLINGTQLMSAYGAYILERSAHLLRLADLLAAMSLEALQGSIVPYDPRIQASRPHPGQITVADNLHALLADSEILDSHRNCGKVQDPYSLRCVPQVHGASRDALAYARRTVEIELNSVTDNPLVFDGGDILSGGNFHGQPLALALDCSAMALAELGSIAERRIYLLLAGHDGLPTLLMNETGVNSGFMIPQYTAAALVSENKVLCHPSCVDSIPTSLGQEDHVSMGSISATKLYRVLRNVETILTIELITASQALDYRLPLLPGTGVRVAHEFVRSKLPHREEDYFFQDDLKPCLELVRSSKIQQVVTAAGIKLV